MLGWLPLSHGLGLSGSVGSHFRHFNADLPEIMLP